VLQIGGVALTRSITVNAVDGVATFTGLGFTSNVSTTQTLNFSSTAFVGTSLQITPSFDPLNVLIATGVTTQGAFYEGRFFASSSTGTANILASDLAANLASFSSVISASGNIYVAADVTTSATASLTLRANGSISLSANVDIQLNGGDLFGRTLITTELDTFDLKNESFSILLVEAPPQLPAVAIFILPAVLIPTVMDYLMDMPEVWRGSITVTRFNSVATTQPALLLPIRVAETLWSRGSLRDAWPLTCWVK
jgi:hypothetical protein